MALLAILMGSLAPSLSHALAKVAGDSRVEVCTTQGIEWIEAGHDGTKPAPASPHAFDHCFYCSPHAPGLGPLPETHRGYLPVGLAHGVSRAVLAAPRTLDGWLGAQPRAPPLFS
jgi:hypothetical protein